jgi:(p)ppGpp synthase/HD superfamily hydrolase
MFAPDRYVAALRFAAERHRGQTITGSDLPYLVHVTSVAAEVIVALPGSTLDPDLAVVCALLHDTLEDTAETPDAKLALAREIANLFGAPVRDGVQALSKQATSPDGTEIPKAERMADSLRRIRDQPPSGPSPRTGSRTALPTEALDEGRHLLTGSRRS